MAYATRSAGRSGALGLTLAINAGAVIALVAWNPNIVKDFVPTIPLIDYPEAKPPPPEVLPDPDPKPRPRQTVDNPGPIVDTGAKSDDWVIDQPPPPPQPGEGTRIDPRPEPPPPPTIVRKPAAMATSPGEMQPPYPPALQRQEIEGSVVVRVIVGADGRPSDIMLVRADDPGFFAATRAWGLRHWRFRPATEDGRAVAGVVQLTVRFTLDA